MKDQRSKQEIERWTELLGADYILSPYQQLEMRVLSLKRRGQWTVEIEERMKRQNDVSAPRISETVRAERKAIADAFGVSESLLDCGVSNRFDPIHKTKKGETK